MPRLWASVLILWLACGPCGARGIDRIERVDMQQALAVGALSDAAVEGVMQPPGSGIDDGWWRLTPTPFEGRRHLLVYHPYSARITVRAPPDYRPRTMDIFQADAGRGHSRRALAFDLDAPGPVYVGVEDARYPLQVAVSSEGAYTVEDYGHVRVLWASLGILTGVSLVALLFWLRLRERVYLLFAGSMFAQVLYVLCAYGDAYGVPGLSWLAAFGVEGIWFIATLSTMVTVWFLLDFAELRPRAPRLSRVLLLVGFYLPGLLLLALVSPWPSGNRWFPPLGNGLLLLANVLAIATLLHVWLKGGRHAGFVLIAWVPLVTVSTARAVQLGMGAPLSTWLEYGLPIMLAFAAVVLVLGLADRMVAFRRERDEAKLHAEHDGLTGAYNRDGITSRLQRALAEARASHQPVSVLFLDLDHFKSINDTHGHPVGDACLRAVVEVIREQARLGDLLGRVGGEEFLLYLPGATLAAASGTADRLLQEVESRCRRVMGAPVNLTLSIGVVECLPFDNVESLIRRADDAMYRAKRAGRNRVVVLGEEALAPAR